MNLPKIPLLQNGKVKTVGVSNHNLAQIKEADAILKESGYRVSAVQNHFSLMNRSSVDSGILDYCKENDITFCTSGSSGIETSVANLQKLYPDVNIVSGNRFEVNAGKDVIASWIEGLN